LIAISGPIILAKISISKDIPSTNWNTIDDLKCPNLSGLNFILKGNFCPIFIIKLSFCITFCPSNSSGISTLFVKSFLVLVLFALLIVLFAVFVFGFFIESLVLFLLFSFLVVLFSIALSLISVCSSFLSLKLFLLVNISIY